MQTTGWPQATVDPRMHHIGPQETPRACEPDPTLPLPLTPYAALSPHPYLASEPECFDASSCTSCIMPQQYCFVSCMFSMLPPSMSCMFSYHGCDYTCRDMAAGCAAEVLLQLEAHIHQDVDGHQGLAGMLDVLGP